MCIMTLGCLANSLYECPPSWQHHSISNSPCPQQQQQHSNLPCCYKLDQFSTAKILRHIKLLLSCEAALIMQFSLTPLQPECTDKISSLYSDHTVFKFIKHVNSISLGCGPCSEFICVSLCFLLAVPSLVLVFRKFENTASNIVDSWQQDFKLRDV